MLAALLDHLIIPADCALHYTLRIPSQWSYANENNDFDVTLPVILRRLSKYARGYFLHRVPTDLLVHYEDQTLSITAHTQDDSTGFHFCIDSPWTYTKENTAAFLGEFTLPEFIHVTELRLEIGKSLSIGNFGSSAVRRTIIFPKMETRQWPQATGRRHRPHSHGTVSA